MPLYCAPDTQTDLSCPFTVLSFTRVFRLNRLFLLDQIEESEGKGGIDNRPARETFLEVLPATGGEEIWCYLSNSVIFYFHI